MEQRDRDGGDGDRQRVGREHPRHADDGRVELGVQIRESEGDDGRVGEGEPHRADQQRDDER